MKSIGDRFKIERESKGLSIEDVARDTNIAKKYLIALETEDFSVFPAEAYLLGFLKNYGDFLGLDVNELQSLYRVLKIQEQPVPVEQLLNTSPNFPKIIVRALVLIAGLSLVGGGAYFIINMPSHSTRQGAASAGKVKVEKQVVEYALNSDSLEKRFFIGDSVVIPLASGIYKVKLESMGEVITISSPVGEYKLALNDTVTIDINDDGTDELTVTASDFEKNRTDLGAQIKFNMTGGGVVVQSDNAAATEAPLVAANSTTILSGNNPYPFTLQISFQGYCMFRWQILREADRSGRQERYFVKGDDLNVQAQNGVRLWASNAASVKINAIGGGRTVPIELGGSGEVIVDDISWTKGSDGKYNLVLSRLDK
ncbi:MAG: helix-turn-helix domain-containing protein [Termitinemataceae bacterium]|nr:MAG: helix-turn-helix domain-containing protein [Termitinemataceae bacterium]